MKPATPKTEPSPSTQLRKGVFGGFLPSVLFALLTAAPLAHAQTPKNPPATPSRTYDIAAFVWPSYHPDDRAKGFWPMGIGEWQTVMSNKPKFEGHDQPRVSLWGYVNESDRYVMEMQIAAAADHGVNFFIYDWSYLEAVRNVFAPKL